MKVQSLVSNNKSKFHVEGHKLPFPMSPHASAKKAGININTDELIVPKTNNSILIIEGAGGLMVPINDETLFIDLIPQFNAEVILISRNYLGSINHTLLSVEALIKRKIHVSGIIFNGEENVETESIILKKSELPLLGRVAEIENISKKTIQEIAELFNKI
jgi:dethiobiotin synthetase